MKATALLFASLFCAGLVRAQAPDCLPPPFILTAAGDVGGPGGFWDNRTIQCQTWTIAYVSSGYSGFTLSLEQAVGNDTPGTWEPYAGTTVASSASFGTAALGVATFSSLSSTAGMSNAAPWVRIDVAGGSGNGSIRITMYGYRTGPTGGTGGGGGGGGGSGCSTPCPVEGVTAAGSPPTVPPVPAAAFDGTDIQPVASDTSGNLKIIGPGAVAAAPVGNPVSVGGTDGTNTRRLSVDSSGHAIAVGGAASGAAQVGNPVPVAGNDGTDVRTVSTDSSGNVNVNVKSNVIPAGTGAFTSAQQSVTASAAALGTNTSKSVCVKALIGNTINVYVGASGVTDSTGFELPPGQGLCVNVNNTNLLYVIASTTGASVSYEWTN